MKIIGWLHSNHILVPGETWTYHPPLQTQLLRCLLPNVKTVAPSLKARKLYSTIIFYFMLRKEGATAQFPGFSALAS